MGDDSASILPFLLPSIGDYARTACAGTLVYRKAVDRAAVPVRRLVDERKVT